MVAKVIRTLRKRARRHPLAWRYLLNLEPTLAYRRHGVAPAGEAARILQELDARGVAVTSADRLLPEGLFAELRGAVGELEASRADELEAARAAAEDVRIGEKTFNVELLGRAPALDPASVFARFALASPVLSVANAYFGMCTRLRYYNVWHTFATRGAPRESQLWHRDREDRIILKIFVYCEDVDEGAGPFTYAPGTHPKGSVRREPAGHSEHGVHRATDAQMAAVVPADEWVRCTGPAGTIVFADTQGYHKGGEARTRDRVMYTALFTSPASQSTELLRRPATLAPAGDAEQAWALRGRTR